MSTISRQEYDEWKIAELQDDARAVEAHRTELGARELHEGSYPKSTSDAMEELNERGFAATDWRIERLCRFPELAPQTVGGTRLWSKVAIDNVAAAMERNGQFTASARWRKDHGLTWRDEQAMLRRHQESKREVAHE